MELEYNNYFKNLRDDDILEQEDRLFKCGKVKAAFETAFDSAIPSALVSHNSIKQIDIRAKQPTDWFTDGVDCQVLKAGSDGWQKGKLKVKVSVEFIPDQPEIPEYQSPLDEIRNHPSFSDTQ